MILVKGKNYSVRETAEILSHQAGEEISISQVRYCIKTGKLKAFKVMGYSVRIKGEEIHRFMKQELISK